MNKFCAVVIAILIYGCGTVGVSNRDAPSWVSNGSPAGFEPELEIAGTGCAVTRRAADGMARKAIAEQIEVHIEGKTDIQTRESSINGRTSNREQVATSAQQSTRITLPGVEIRERYTDGRRVCSLAVMDRARTARAISAATDGLEVEIRKLIEHSAGYVDAIDAVAGWGAIAEKVAQFQRNAGILCVLVSECGRTGVISESTAQDELQKATRSLVVDVKINGNGGGDTTRDLLAALSDKGVATASGKRAPLVITGKVRMKPGSRRAAGVVFRSITAKLQLVRVSDGAVLATAAWSDEVGQASRAIADQVLLSDLKTNSISKFAREVAAKWRGFLGQNYEQITDPG